MDDPLRTEMALADALRLSADPPSAWIDAAALIPSTLGDLSSIERLTSDPAFRARFREDPATAVSAAGLTPSTPVLAALRDHLGA